MKNNVLVYYCDKQQTSKMLKKLFVLLFCSLPYEGLQPPSILKEQIIQASNGQFYKISYIHMEPFKDKVLLVKPIATVAVQNHEVCRRACLKTTGCISINLRIMNATFFSCHLMNKDHYSRKHLLIDEVGSEYQVIWVRNSLKKRTILISFSDCSNFN